MCLISDSSGVAVSFMAATSIPRQWCRSGSVTGYVRRDNGLSSSGVFTLSRQRAALLARDASRAGACGDSFLRGRPGRFTHQVESHMSIRSTVTSGTWQNIGTGPATAQLISTGTTVMLVCATSAPTSTRCENQSARCSRWPRQELQAARDHHVSKCLRRMIPSRSRPRLRRLHLGLSPHYSCKYEQFGHGPSG